MKMKIMIWKENKMNSDYHYEGTIANSSEFCLIRTKRHKWYLEGVDGYLQ